MLPKFANMHNLKPIKKEEKMSTPSSSKLAPAINDSGYFTPSPARTEWDSPDSLNFNPTPDLSTITPDLPTTTPNPSSRTLPVPQNLSLKLQTDRLLNINDNESFQTNINPNSDILSKLYERNCSIITSQILRSLDEKDLAALSCVCKCWRNICSSDIHANQRRRKYLKLLRLNRENNKHSEYSETTAKGGQNRDPFNSILNILEPQNEPQPSDVKLTQAEIIQKRFDDVVKTLKDDELLDKCPLCGSPARYQKPQKIAKCSYARCTYQYCISCRCSYENTHSCSPIKLNFKPKPKRSRAQTKHSLRRLLL